MLRQGIQAGRLLSVIGRSRVVYPTNNLLRVSQAAVTFRHNYSTEPKCTPFVTAPKIQFPQAYSRSFSVTSSYYNEKSSNEEVQSVQTETLKDGEDISNVLESKHEVQALETESVVGQLESHDFQAETRKILDIVARSLYTDREVFLRELISNASDALEKLRHRTIQAQEIIDNYLQPEIHLIADEKAKTITIQDFGIGMSKEELIQNLGTIARSGTSEFVKNLADSPQKESLIGQFGVGFYSTFMVGDQVKVFSRSAVPGSKGYCWVSDGSGKYSVAEAEGVQRGTKITIYLKDDAVDFCKEKNIKSVIEKYSNFVNFNITLNGKEVNKIKAIWTMPKGEVTEEMHKEFYQFIANAYDHPLYTLHFTSDTPLNMSALFYAPESHMEKFGMGRMEPGVSLFCRRVLIQHKMKGLLPEYLRFIKGVVDCEDIPLNLSREHLQDSALIKRVGTVLTRRVLKFLGTESKKDEVKYSKFFSEYGTFLKEGIVTDIENKEAIASLLRMDSSSMAGTDTSLTSLDDYIARMKPEQKDIYYLVTAKRDFALTSPYYEGFKRKGVEVLFLYSALDDFVMNNLAAYKGRTLSPIESADIDSLTDEKKEEEKKEESTDSQLNESQLKDLQQWIKDVLNERVSSVKASHRLHDSPAIVIDNESASFRRMMKFADPLRAPTIPKQAMEINSKHPIMVKLSAIKDDNPDVAKRVIEQVFDNALIAAGLMEDSRAMLPRLNAILEAALKK